MVNLREMQAILSRGNLREMQVPEEYLAEEILREMQVAEEYPAEEIKFIGRKM